MSIIQIKGKSFTILSDSAKSEIKVVDYCPISSLKFKAGDVVLLDYNSYYNREMLPESFNRSGVMTYSPHELIGAYLKAKSAVLGDIQVIDIEDNVLYAYEIAFIHNRYTFRKHIGDHISILVDDLLKSILGLNTIQLDSFKHFLLMQSNENQNYSDLIRAAIEAYTEGASEYNDIFAVLDQTEWAHLKLDNLLRFKEQVFRLCNIDPSKPCKMFGWFGLLFGDMMLDCNEKITGWSYLKDNLHSFFAPLSESISLEVFSYPTSLKVPVYEVHSEYQTYTSFKSINLIDTGYIKLFRDNNLVQVKTRNSLKLVIFELKMDGNQNILLTTGSETYIVA